MNTVFLICLTMVAAALVVYSLMSGLRSTKGPQSMASLIGYLRFVDARFEARVPINAEAERKEMEIWQNKTKTTCDQRAITANEELKLLVSKVYTEISAACERSGATDRSSWIKLKALAFA